MRDEYQYQSVPLPEFNIPGSATFSPREFGTINPPGGATQAFPTQQSPLVPTGGSTLGGNGPTVDLELCNGDTVRVQGFLLPP